MLELGFLDTLMAGGSNTGASTTEITPMMQLGEFQFSLNTAAYQDLSRSTAYRWASIERFGQQEALQYLGEGSDTITLQGVIFTNYKGGPFQVEKIRSIAKTGKPQQLVDGSGIVYGQYVIEGIDEKQSIFSQYGSPLKQEFTIKLKRYVEYPQEDETTTNPNAKTANPEVRL